MHNGFIWSTVDTTAPVLSPFLSGDMVTEVVHDSSPERNELLLFGPKHLERAYNAPTTRPDARPDTHILSD
jgi:hypothetical protein